MSRPGLRGTVRARVTLVAALTVVVVLAVAAVGLVLVQRRVLVDQLEESLRTDVDQVLAAVERDRDEPTLLVPGGDDDAVAQVATLDGEVLAATPNIAGRPPIAPAPVDEATTTIRSIEDDEPYRLLSTVASASDRDVVVHVAAPLDDIAAATRSVGAALAVAVPVVTALLAALVFLLVGRTLRPVEQIRREADAIGPDDLHRRVPQPAGDDEIARLATTMNTMLDRLERGDRRQRRFVADASHELRTPLARTRAELEVDLRHPETADARATTQSVLDEVEHLQRLVEDLLVLARHDTTGAAAHPAPCRPRRPRARRGTRRRRPPQDRCLRGLGRASPRRC